MKSILISVKPKYCELIASGKKTIEVRKTKPKLETPFKVYIYMTKEFNRGVNSSFHWYKNGKVIGEFVCNNIDWHGLSNLIVKEDAEHALSGTCLTKEEVLDYLGYQEGISIYACKNYDFYGWHISNLVIYDKPRELSEFRKSGALSYDDWLYGMYNGNTENSYEKYLLPFTLTRPPQSWCYVESEVDTE